MSLINDYLKKTEEKTPPSNLQGDIPPSLKKIGKGGIGKYGVHMAAVIVTCTLAGASYVVFITPRTESTKKVQLAGVYPIKQAKTASRQAEKRVQPLSVKGPSLKTKKRAPVSTPSPLEEEGLTTLPLRDKTRPDIPTKEPEKTRPGKETLKEKRVLAMVSEKEAKMVPEKEVKGADMAAKVPEVSHSIVTILAEKKTVESVSIRSRLKKPETPTKPLHKKTVPREKRPIQIGMLERSNEDINRCYQNGLVAQRKGDYQGAGRYYLKVLERDPSNMNTLTNLSAVYILLEKYAEAKKILDKICRIDVNNVKAIVNLGIIDFNLGHYGMAKQRFQEALQINPREESALINLAYLAQRENNIPLMEKNYNEILRISPVNHEVLLAYASLLEKNKRFTEALGCYRKSLELDGVKSDSGLTGQIRDRIRLLTYYYYQGESRN